MTVQNEPRKHHWLPQFMMRPWVADSGEMATFMRYPKRVVFKPKSPAAIGYEPNLYRVEGAKNPVLFEQTFQQFETQAANLRDRMLSHGVDSLSAEERQAFASTAMLCANRRPEKIHSKTKIAEAQWRDEANRILAGNIPTTQPATDLLDAIKEGVAKTLVLEAAIESAQGFGQQVAGLSWRLFDFSNEQFKLVLADRPILAGGASGKIEWVTLPLGPNTLFVAGAQRSYEEIKFQPEFRESLAIEVIGGQFRQCANWVVAVARDPYFKLAEMYMTAPDKPAPLGTL